MPAYSFVIRSLAISFILASSVAAAADLPRVPLDKSQFRRPVAITRLDETTAVVANRCGTLSVIDLENWTVAAEYQLGGQPTDVAMATKQLLVTDSARDRLIVISISREKATVDSELPMPTSS